MRLVAEIAKNMARKPNTQKYPYVKPKTPEKIRAKHEYFKDKCIFCGLCAMQCPANAITVDKENKKYSLDLGKCVFCGQCEEACASINKNAIILGKDYELAGSEKKKFVMEF